jgi:hypothetical protein
MVSVSRKTMVKFGDGLGSCNITVEEVDPAIQGVAIPPNGQKPDASEFQTERLTADCLAALKADAERSQFLIDNTNLFGPVQFTPPEPAFECVLQ